MTRSKACHVKSGHNRLIDKGGGVGLMPVAVPASPIGEPDETAGLKMEPSKPAALQFRSLQAEDYDRGYLECLSHLTTVGDISREQFNDRLKWFQERPDLFKHIVVSDGQQILAAGTLVVEPKFIRQCASTGHVEDIVVHPQARGLGLGKQLVARLVELAREAGCYKVTLECTDDNVEFYAKCGLTRKGNQMCVYF